MSIGLFSGAVEFDNDAGFSGNLSSLQFTKRIKDIDQRDGGLYIGTLAANSRLDSNGPVLGNRA